MKQLNLNQLYRVYGGVNNASSNPSSSGSGNNQGEHTRTPISGNTGVKISGAGGGDGQVPPI